MIAMLKSNADNRSDHRRPSRWALSISEIIRFFGFPKSTVYDIVAKYTALEVQRKFQYANEEESKECTRGLPQWLEGLKY